MFGLRSVLIKFSLLSSIAFLTACGTPQGLTLNYSPSSIKSAEGAVEVGDFKYSAVDPRTRKAVPSNQIRNTAMGQIIIDREVSKFVRDAVFSELRLVGVKTAAGSKILTGDVEEFLIDDLGYSIDWTYRVKYSVTQKDSGQVLFTDTKNIQRKTAKFGNPLGALNETVKLSVEQLLDDPQFVKAMN